METNISLFQAPIILPVTTTTAPSTPAVVTDVTNRTFGFGDVRTDICYPQGGMGVLESFNNSVPAAVIRPAENLMACQHLITTYVIPNFLHFIAYVIGFVYFRLHDNEQLYALMEKVFLQATPLQGRMVSQSNMIRRMR